MLNGWAVRVIEIATKHNVPLLNGPSLASVVSLKSSSFTFVISCSFTSTCVIRPFITDFTEPPLMSPQIIKIMMTVIKSPRSDKSHLSLRLSILFCVHASVF